jgi:hypothetical protein
LFFGPPLNSNDSIETCLQVKLEAIQYFGLIVRNGIAEIIVVLKVIVKMPNLSGPNNNQRQLNT